MLGRYFRLDAAPTRSVTSDDDLAFDVDAQLFKLIVVRGHSIIDINKLAGHIAVDRVSVIGRQLIRLTRSRVFRYGRFFQHGLKTSWLDHFKHSLSWCRKQDLELFKLRVDAPRLVLVANPFRILFVVSRTNVMRLG